MEEKDHTNINGKDNTAEQHKLCLMRALVEHRDPSAKVLSSQLSFFCSFLLANSRKMKKLSKNCS